MFTRVRIAIRFFFFGLAVGVLLAPRSGAETRRLVREKADRLLNDVLDAATLGTAETGSGRRAAEADAGPRRAARGGGNGSRSRKSAETSAAETAEAAEAESAPAS